MERESLLTNADWRLMDIVWDHEPLKSTELCVFAARELDWKRTTTYTVIKRLSEKGYLKSKSSVVTSLIAREEVGREEGKQLVQRGFKGSLPAFLAAFIDEGDVSKEDAAEIERLIGNYRGRN